MRWRGPMAFCGATFLCSVLVLEMLGCGGMSMHSSSNRVLESISLTPSSADARNFLSGPVLFIAFGTFSKAPSPAPIPAPFMAPYSGTWTTSNSKIATVDQFGVATCAPGASGTVTITATVSSNSANASAMSTAVSGTATLTCP